MTSDNQYIESDLIERCRRGETKAQFMLYKQYSKAMYNIAIRFTNNKMDAEDILQESFLTAFEKLPELQNSASFPLWLKRIVVNRCIDQVRKNRPVFDDIDKNLPEGYEMEDEPDFTIDPAIVHSSVKNLPPGGRTILVLHALEGYKHREIAGMLGISESTSKSQYKRALELLNRDLKQKIYVT
ncbi:MAG: sigma-70 family RNA polymerase sigma factor [Bacteroidota bacterium]